MGDHFVLLVDRLITETTLEAAIESRNRSMQATSSALEDGKIDVSCQKIDLKDVSSTRGKLAECRICQDEDQDSNMETPCSCCGSLMYAHRRCVQRWCNEKGDTVCEICHQQFKPGYTAPPPLFQLGRIPMNFRGNWEISRRDSPRIIAMVATDRDYLNPGYDDYSASTARNVLLSLACFHFHGSAYSPAYASSHHQQKQRVLSPTCYVVIVTNCWDCTADLCNVDGSNCSSASAKPPRSFEFISNLLR
nr:uncharacterized protein LOC103452258 [Malus domestica]XP_028947849.1 uncharacterized protein LOC103452258 [Malus domestica]